MNDSVSNNEQWEQLEEEELHLSKLTIVSIIKQYWMLGPDLSEIDTSAADLSSSYL